MNKYAVAYTLLSADTSLKVFPTFPAIKIECTFSINDIINRIQKK